MYTYHHILVCLYIHRCASFPKKRKKKRTGLLFILQLDHVTIQSLSHIHTPTHTHTHAHTRTHTHRYMHVHICRCTNFPCVCSSFSNGITSRYTHRTHIGNEKNKRFFSDSHSFSPKTRRGKRRCIGNKKKDIGDKNKCVCSSFSNGNMARYTDSLFISLSLTLSFSVSLCLTRTHTCMYV